MRGMPACGGGLGCNVLCHVAIGCSGCRYVGLRCGQCDEHFFMLMHSCHECGEPWAIWLCGVILPLLFLAGCVGFLWFESGHQTRCLSTDVAAAPLSGLPSGPQLRLPLAPIPCVGCVRPTEWRNAPRSAVPLDVRYSQYCVCIL